MHHLQMLIALALTIGLAGRAQGNAKAQTVAFVCEHGNSQSMIAAAHFNRTAPKGFHTGSLENP